MLRNFFNLLFFTVLLGTSKSMFQFYRMARYVRPELFGTLPPNKRGQTDPPRLIVREVGKELMEIYDLMNMKAYEMHSDILLLHSLDPLTDEYWYEPMNSLVEPSQVFLPTFTTVLPNERRYKEFVKNGGIKVYMPAYTERQLLAIGQHMRQLQDFPKELEETYSDEGIVKGFAEFGGIIRHVLPSSLSSLKESTKKKNNAIGTTDWKLLLSKSPDIEYPDISHHVMMYVIPTIGPLAFECESLDFVNYDVKKQMKWN
jgi:hypothetical protein